MYLLKKPSIQMYIQLSHECIVDILLDGICKYEDVSHNYIKHTYIIHIYVRPTYILYTYCGQDRYCACPVVTTYKYTLVHKRMSILTFEGLSTTFEASTNVYFIYFCHKIICYSDYTCITVASKMLTSNN